MWIESDLKNLAYTDKHIFLFTLLISIGTISQYPSLDRDSR